MRVRMHSGPVVSESARMLARMIGSDIELRLELGTGPLEIEADQAQLDQVLLNLALNARDAMPAGGRLTIETRAIEAGDDPRCGSSEEPEPPGHRVMPGLNGREVAEQISLLRPEIRKLYMSGHTRDALGSRFELDAAIQLVQKPFLPTELIHHLVGALASHAVSTAPG